MSKHTKGPWTLKHVSGSNFANQRFEIRGMFGDRPAAYPIFNMDTSALAGATVCCSPGDAALIAAAPELLEALEASNLLLRTKRHACESTEVCRVLDTHIARNSAAIAKARGES